mmetsp:Transcript_37750/g.94918  ORF Transcript_37750/g.94918 Transcript_37750/m.94918 type:complete len:104 (-) Transcript_37750:1733-2044(-)
MSAICGKLQIEYCASCGFGQRFINVKREVTSAHKKVTVVGNPSAPRRGAFEVTFVDRDANETLLFSKFKCNRFPQKGEIVGLLEHFVEHGEVPEVDANKCIVC